MPSQSGCALSNSKCTFYPNMAAGRNVSNAVWTSIGGIGFLALVDVNKNILLPKFQVTCPNCMYGSRSRQPFPSLVGDRSFCTSGCSWNSFKYKCTDIDLCHITLLRANNNEKKNNKHGKGEWSELFLPTTICWGWMTQWTYRVLQVHRNFKNGIFSRCVGNWVDSAVTCSRFANCRPTIDSIESHDNWCWRIGLEPPPFFAKRYLLEQRPKLTHETIIRSGRDKEKRRRREIWTSKFDSTCI